MKSYFVFGVLLCWYKLSCGRYHGRNVIPIRNILFQLGRHDVYPDRITLSGFSSGGTFAQQLFITHSSLFSGIASFSHAYYRCGPGNGREIDYDNACTIIGSNNTYNVENALQDIRMYERMRLIESTTNLQNKKLYLYAGSRSEFFSLDQSLGAVRIFEPYIKNFANIKTRVQDAAQLLPTDRYGRSCTLPASGNLFVGNCGFSGAADSLKFLLGDSVIRNPGATVRPRIGQLLTFDQTEFFYGYNGPEYMDSKGYIFVPTRCHHQRCLLHFYFHGCLTGREFNGTAHLMNSGFLEVAEVNNLIVVFPQALSSPENMIGCWDTYGLTGKLYATSQGAQISVVRNMIMRILGADNEVLTNSNGSKNREREPLGYEFEIFKGREVFLP